jgi:hypothetical protein
MYSCYSSCILVKVVREKEKERNERSFNKMRFLYMTIVS